MTATTLTTNPTQSTTRTQSTTDAVPLPRWQRLALYVIGAWTALGGVSALADPAAQGATFFGSANAFAASGGALVVFQIAYVQLIAWGVGYALAARLPAARTPILAAGALGKASYFVLTVLAFASGRGTAALLATGILDLAIAAFFALVLLRRPRVPS